MGCDESEGFAEGKTEGREAGLAEGRAEGFAQGKTEGFAEGKTEGLNEGELKKAREMAAKMLAKNKPIEEIMEFTGLPEPEILAVKSRILL